LFEIEKGELIDPVKGEYTGANAAVKKKSLGAISRVYLYTAFDYPHTSCGCFEGRQVDGFHGISIEYMRSPKFLQADGGWNRIVWMPSDIKERLKEFIPKELFDKITTEKDVKAIDELKEFLKTHEHPVVKRWTEVPAEVEAEAAEEEVPVVAVAPLSATSFTAGGFRIILKDAKIHAKKVIIKTIKKR